MHNDFDEREPPYSGPSPRFEAALEKVLAASDVEVFTLDGEKRETPIERDKVRFLYVAWLSSGPSLYFAQEFQYRSPHADSEYPEPFDGVTDMLEVIRSLRESSLPVKSFFTRKTYEQLAAEVQRACGEHVESPFVCAVLSCWLSPTATLTFFAHSKEVSLPLALAVTQKVICG